MVPSNNIFSYIAIYFEVEITRSYEQRIFLWHYYTLWACILQLNALKMLNDVFKRLHPARSDWERANFMNFYFDYRQHL